MQNRQRPGPLEKVIMEDYNNAEVDPVSNTTKIYAPDHKTSTSGPGAISMFKDPDDALFVNESGRQFEKGTIGRRTPELWATAKVRSDILNKKMIKGKIVYFQ